MTIVSAKPGFGGKFWIARAAHIAGARRDRTLWTVRPCATEAEANELKEEWERDNALIDAGRWPSFPDKPLPPDGDGVCYARRFSISVFPAGEDVDD